MEIYPEKAVGVGEHPDVLEAIEKELAVIAQHRPTRSVSKIQSRGINESIRQDQTKA